jgi:outer membrane protein OmpA-like peptidoglycan-associated protein
MNRSLAQTGILLIIIVASARAQTRSMADSIRLVNPSFEDVPKQSSPPLGWADCGFTGESAPDVHPSNFWEVSKPALNGKTYVGLVVRNNDTWERISQMLESPLQGGQCYDFSVYISSSENYKSRTNVANAGIIKLQSDSIFNFNIPAVLRIWAGNISCGRSELLAESPPIDNFEWKRYDFRLKPKSNYNYIMFEAFFKTPVLFPYNGNILLDHASSLKLVPCSQPVEPPKPPVAVVKPKPLPPPKDTAKPTGPVAVQAAKPKVGEIIKINNLYFNANSDSIPPHSYSALDDLFKYLLANETLVVEIGGHTNGLPKDDFCDSLSTLRAKAVAKYLMQKGIPKERMTFVGYGRRKPIDTNATREGRARNQRVELKILSS